MLAALKWLVKFLETRFPEKVMPVSQTAFDEEITTLHKHDAAALEELVVLKKQVEEMQKHIEILNLRVGLSRPIQTVLRSNKHG